jgi:hypothetical protein
MDVDVGKFLRLSNLVTRAMDSVPFEQAALAGRALAGTYGQVRGEVLAAIPEEVREEFERLFPESVRTQQDARGAAVEVSRFNAAKVALGSLAGWLQGFIDEARLRFEAEAYAAERVKQERIGFRPGE